MARTLSEAELEEFFRLDRVMNREGLDGEDLDDWFKLCSMVQTTIAGPSNSESNERTAFRVPVKFPVDMTVGGSAFKGVTRNVSVQGASVASAHPLPIDNRTVHLTIHFTFPRFLRRAKVISLDFGGHVRWSKIGRSSIMNLEFLPVPADTFEVLEDLLHQCIRKQIG